jgi:hypothetical protein
MNCWGGFVVGTTSCLTKPGCVRQVNGVGVGVAGTGLGGTVAVAVAVEEITVGVGVFFAPFDGKQAESPVRSER